MNGMDRCVDRRWRLFIRLTAAALLGAVVWMVILAIHFSGPESPESGRVRPLEWASVQGTPLSLPNEVAAAPGEPVYMELTLPHGFSSLCLRSTQQTVEAYLDGRLIYEYKDKLPMVKASPSHWNLVDLPAESGGRVLTLVLTSPYQGFSGRVNQPFLGSRADLVQFLQARSLPVLIISFVLLVAGAFLMLYSAVTRRSLPSSANACLGTCLLVFAFWSLTECQSLTVFVGTEEVNTLLSFLTVMVFPLPYLLYVRSVSGPRFLCWTDGLFLAAGLLLLCGVILQITGTLDLLEIRGASYGFLLLTLLYSAVVFWLEHRRWPEGVVKLQLIGIVLFLFFILIDLYVEYCTDGFLVSGMFSRTGITLFVFTLALMARRLRVAELLRGLELDKQTALMERQIASAEERLRQMNENMALMRQYRHDMRHQLLLLAGLVEQGKVDLLKDQLQRMTGALEFPAVRRYCRDEMLDIVLTAYLERAERLNARVSYNIRLDEEHSQWGTDLNVILANALENAVRALGEAQEPRRLSVRLVADGRRLVLQVKNSSRPVAFNTEGLPLRESGEPGIGSRSILRIVEQHHGAASYSYDYKDEMFLLNGVIPYS